MEKYFTPSIEDIRVGYECEWLLADGLQHVWKPYKASPELIEKAYNFGTQFFRVPYLTKEQIEADGWKLTAAHDIKTPQYNYRKGDIDLYFRPDRRQVFLNRLDYSRTGRHDTDFNLVLKDISINELRYICKLLGI